VRQAAAPSACDHRVALGFGDGAYGSPGDSPYPSRAPGGRVETQHTRTVGVVGQLALVAHAVHVSQMEPWATAAVVITPPR
jgi:hypothetical protein